MLLVLVGIVPDSSMVDSHLVLVTFLVCALPPLNYRSRSGFEGHCNYPCLVLNLG